MGELDRPKGHTPRRAKEQRAYRLVIATGVLGTLGVVGVVLSIAGIGSFGLSMLVLILAAVCAYLFRRTVS